MLTGLGYNPGAIDSKYKHLQVEDEIIFNQTGSSDRGSRAWGVVTGRAFDKERNDSVFVVAPSPGSSTDNPGDYALILVPASMVEVPKFGDEDGAVVQLGDNAIVVTVDQRWVILDQDWVPKYRYELRLSMDGTSDVDEVDMDTLVNGKLSVQRL